LIDLRHYVANILNLNLNLQFPLLSTKLGGNLVSLISQLCKLSLLPLILSHYKVYVTYSSRTTRFRYWQSGKEIVGIVYFKFFESELTLLLWRSIVFSEEGMSSVTNGAQIVKHELLVTRSRSKVSNKLGKARLLLCVDIL